LAHPRGGGMRNSSVTPPPMTKTATHPVTVQTIQTMYAAFGRGDIPGILAHLTDNVEWRLNVDQNAAGAKAVPDFRPFRGRADVQEFFTAIGRDLEFHSFEPVSFLVGGQEVAARVFMELTVRRTGRRIRLESMHHFTFDEKGRVTRFVEFLDSLGVASAWGAVQAKT
jgi:uncharacterized protein